MLLRAGGVFSISRRLQIPPSDSLKLFSTLLQALRKNGIAEPERHICAIRNWNTYTIAVSAEPLTEIMITAVKEFCAYYRFDIVYFPGLQRKQANVYNRRPEAIYYDNFQGLLTDLHGREKAESTGRYVDTTVPTDDRPYFSRFIRWSRIKDLYTATGERSHTFFFSGEILIALVFVIALILSVVIILIPPFIAGRQVLRGSLSLIMLFGLLGAGYMLFEIAWIKKLTLIVGHPGVSFAAVLTILLTASGLGGWYSQKISEGHINAVFLIAAAGTALSGTAAVLLPPVLSSLPDAAVLALVAPCIAVPGFLLGLPLSLTIRCLSPNPSLRAFGWAVNGTVSVLTSAAASLIAVYAGISMLLWLAAGVYGAGFILVVARGKIIAYIR
ncbi:MAG: hypothetical protein HN368_23410, partial [Spirochaetales bacterium]|nr:hypothetical protein [Spirochaetales bacterium]